MPRLEDQETGVLPPKAPGDDATLAGAPAGLSAVDLLDQATPAFAPAPNADDSDADADETLAGVAMPQQPSGPLQVGGSFGDRYEILETLGVGGMGAVYKALDRELGVPVALKVILIEDADPGLAAELNARFKRELLLARDVTHPNVVRIHDLGDIDGMKYFTMSYVDGEDLSSLLKRKKRLEIPEALAIFRQIVDGLIAAHDRGIVHRDLKPANVMIDGAGQAMLMDFGIARTASEDASATASVQAFEEARATVDLGNTMAGAIVGTLAYMAPEQFKGKTADQRADVYALGLILYDMLMGSRRAQGATSAIDEVKQRLDEPPLSVHSIDESIPKALDDIIERALAPNPDDRIQSTAELKNALDRLDSEGLPKPRLTRTAWTALAGLALLALVALGGTYILGRSATPAAEPEPTTVLIADFANGTGDEVFDGVLEQAVQIGLEGASFVNTFPRQRARERAAAISSEGSNRLDSEIAMLIAQSEGLSVVIEGSIEPASSGYQVEVSARDARSGDLLATSERKASSRDQVLAAVGKAVIRLRTRLGDTVDTDRALQEETFTAASLEAAQSYTTAQDLMASGDWQGALPFYLEAVRLDESFGRAYAGLGASSFNLGRPNEAEEYYQLALANTARMTDREKYRTRGAYYIRKDNWPRAAEELQALVDEYPADEAGLSNLALAQFYGRQFQDALEGGRRAVETYPRNVLSRANLALYAMYAGQFELAEQEAAQVLEENPNYATAYVPVALSALDRGAHEDALAAYEKLSLVPGGAGLARLARADAALYLGDAEKAIQILDAADTEDSQGSDHLNAVSRLLQAEAEWQRGGRQEALTLADEALELSPASRVLFSAGLLRAGNKDREGTLELAAQLGSELEAEPRALASLLEGELELALGNAVSALEHFNEAKSLADSWWARYALGRAYLAAGAFAEAEAELDQCLDRRGEATALFLDDLPTYHVFPEVFRLLGEARRGLGSAAADEAFDEYQTRRASERDAEAP